MTPNFLTHASDLPTEAFPWGQLQWLCNARLLPGAAQTLGLCTLHPGQGNPLHYHPNCEELLLVLEGSGRHLIGGEWVELKEGTTIRVPIGMRHQLINTGPGPLRCVIAFSSGERETVFVE